MAQVINLAYIKKLEKYDKFEAIKLLIELCDDGDVDAISYINSISISTYLVDIILEFGDDEIDYYIGRSCKYLYSTWFLGYLYMVRIPTIRRNYEKAFELLTWAHENGCVIATCLLGNIYCTDIVHAKDYVKAIELYKLASDKGYSYVTRSLGYMYCNGMGVVKDYRQSVKLYIASFQLGLSIGLDSLISLYEDELSEICRIYIIESIIEAYNRTGSNRFRDCIKTMTGDLVEKINNNPEIISESLITILENTDYQSIYGDDIPIQLIQLRKIFSNCVDI